MRKVARPAPRPRKYELMIVVAPTVTEDGLPNVVERVTALIEAQDGTIESFTHDSPWGHRRLAYPIQNFRDAFYVLYYFNIAPRAITELDRELRLDDAIIRHLIVKFDPLASREGQADSDDDEDDGDEIVAEEPAEETPAVAEAESTSDAADEAEDAADDDSEDESESDEAGAADEEDDSESDDDESASDDDDDESASDDDDDESASDDDGDESESDDDEDEDDSDDGEDKEEN